MFTSQNVTAPYSAYTTFLHCTNTYQVSRCKQHLVSAGEASPSVLVAPDKELPTGSNVRQSVTEWVPKCSKFRLMTLKNGSQTTLPDVYYTQFCWRRFSNGLAEVWRSLNAHERHSFALRGPLFHVTESVYWPSNCINWNDVPVICEFGGLCCPVPSPLRFLVPGSFSFPW